MSIDYSIPLGIKPVQINSPLQTMGRLMEFQALRDQAETRKLDAEKRRRALEDEEALGQAFTTLDRKTAIDTVTKAGKGHLVPVINKQYDDWDKAALDRQAAITTAREVEQKYLGRLFSDVRAKGYDPFAALAAVDHATATLGEPFAPRAREIRAQIEAAGDDPKAVQAIVDSIERQDPNYNTRQTAEASAARAKVTTEQAAITAPKLKAEARQKLLEGDAQELSAAGNQAAYTEMRNALPYDRARLFPDKYDPDRIRQVGLTPAQATTDANADASRAQTARYQSASIANAQASLQERIAENQRVAARAGEKIGPDGRTRSGGLPPGERGVIERWYADNMNELDDDSDLSPTERDTRKGRIQAAYDRAVGSAAAAPVTPAPPAGGGTMGSLFGGGVIPGGSPAMISAPGVPPVAAGRGTLGGIGSGATKSPAAKAASTAPAEVQEALADQKPGTYRLKDPDTGAVEVWVKSTDGTLKRK
jgi:hypothetical protein